MGAILVQRAAEGARQCLGPAELDTRRGCGGGLTGVDQIPTACSSLCSHLTVLFHMSTCPSENLLKPARVYSDVCQAAGGENTGPMLNHK